MGDNKRISVKIGADISQLETAVSTASSKLSTLSTNLQSAGSAMLPVTGAVTALGAAFVVAGNDWDAAAKTIQTATGTTGAELESLKQSAQNVFGNVPADAETVAAAIGTLNTHLGATGPVLETLTTQLIDVSRALGEDAAANADAFGTALNSFGISAADAGPQLDFLFTVTQDYGVSLSDLLGNLNTFGPVLQNAGFSMAEAAEFMGQLNQSGVSVSRVMPALNKALRDAAAQGVTDLKSHLIDATEAIANATDKSSALDQAVKIFGAEGAARMTAALQAGNISLTDLAAGFDSAKGAIQANAEDTRTLADRWQIFKNQLETAVAPLGTQLVSALERLLEAARPVLDWIQGAVEWFTNLPAPIQTAVGAVAGLAAALGPLLIAGGAVAGAISSIAAALPVMGAALAPLAGLIAPIPLAIAAVTAALVALGAWVYANWDSIVAVLRQAWDGIKEAWGAVWDGISEWLGGVWEGYKTLMEYSLYPVIQAIELIWEPVKKAFESAWTVITEFLYDVWDGIKSTAEDVWNAITDAIDGFLEIAEKIPGVNKLLDLDDAWNSAKKLKEETESLTSKVKDKKTVLESTIPKLETYTSRLNTTKTATTGLKDATDDLDEEYRKYLDATKIPFNPPTGKIEELKQAAEDAHEKLADLADQAPTIPPALDTAFTEIPSIVETDLTAPINDAGSAIVDLKDTATVELPNVKSSFETFSTDVSSEISGLATDLANSLFEGDTSWGEKLKNALTSIKDSFLNTFVTPVIDMITGPEGLIKKALEPLLSNLTNISTKVTELFGSGGGGSPVPGTGGGVPGVPAGGPGGGSGAGSAAAAGVGGLFSTIFTGISAVTGIVGVFQNARQETTLNAIELNTRRATRYLGDREDGGIMTASLKTLEWLTYNVANTDEIKSTLWTIRDTLQERLPNLDGLGGSADANYIVDNTDEMKSTLWEIRDKFKAYVPDISVNVTKGLDELTDIAGQSNLYMHYLQKISTNTRGLLRRRQDINIDVHFDGLVAAVAKQVKTEIVREYKLQTP